MNRQQVAEAGHTGDIALATAALASPDPSMRATALGALERLGCLDDNQLRAGLTDTDAAVRRRGAQLAARHRLVGLFGALEDDDAMVIEMAAWAAGEREDAGYVGRLVELASGHDDALVREAAVAALGAIGDPAGLPAILKATTDKPAVRRRAIIALTPFDSPEADAAVERAKADKDWQVRMVAEELG